MRRLIKLPPNDSFYAMFRAWYLVCHMTDVMPRRLELAELVNSALSIFGVSILVRDAGAPADAGAGGAMVPSGKPDAGVKPRAPHVDKEEHRKGMPVRDNLLE